MLKAFIISVNLLAIIALKFFFGGDVTIEQKFPNQINKGESFTVEVLINKGDREGFAKWQQKLPAGFIAEVKDAKGATFSFKNQDVKLIWMALPTEETFSIFYTISIDPSLSGSFELDGKFSYIEENERKDIQAAKKSIVIGESVNKQIAAVETVEAVETEEKPEVKEESNETEAIQENNAEDLANETDANELVEADSPIVQTEKSTKGELVTNDENIKIYRKVEHLENGEYQISLSINKGNFDSFGKVEEYLPEGFIAFEGENDNSMFSFKNQVVKFLWMTLPSKNDIELTYRIKSESDLLDQVRLHGMFSYLNQDNSIQLEMQASEFKNYFIDEAKDEIAEEPKQPDTAIEETANKIAQPIAEVVETKKEEVKPVKTEEVISKPKQAEASISDITNIPSPESSVVYKVQIAAGKKEVNQQYFIKNHGIQEMVTIEYHDSWYKYTLGKFDVYKAARDRRNEIWAADNKINDAFVTAYNSGERITVQEALMISNQKWLK